MNLEDICHAMSDPLFYPHPVSGIERKDTHISAVMLTGDWVYKIKKPVDFGFLDFTSLDARRHFCRREVQLNRRLSSDVYSGVASIQQDRRGSLRLVVEAEGVQAADGENGENGWRTVEYAVRMRQLPEASNFVARLENQEVTDRQLDDLGDHLGRFYGRAERGPEIDRLGDWGTVRQNVEENFRQTEPFAGDWLGGTLWSAVREASLSFLDHRQELFHGRVSGGLICNGHGDLRAEHIYFHRGIQIVDCVEFNDRFRYLDPASDLGYLHSDLEFLGHRPAGLRIIERYARLTSDWDVYRLVDFYSAYRAMVQLKVHGLRSAQVEGKARSSERARAGSYLALAFRACLRFSRPTLWIFGGLIASGKSTLSGQLSGFYRIPRYSSDAVRKELASSLPGRTGVQEFGRNLYRPEMRNRVYAELMAKGQAHLREKRSVVLDATFSKRHWREEAARLARDHGADYVFVQTVCEERTIRDRLRRREAGHDSESDARLGHLQDFLRSFEPPEEIPRDHKLSVRTEGPVAETLHRLVSLSYALKCGQTARIDVSEER